MSTTDSNRHWPEFDDEWLRQHSDQEVLGFLDRDERLFRINAEGESLLSLAACHGRLAIVKELLRRGMPPDYCGYCPAICHATREGHTGVVRLLLEAGADPNSGCDDGSYALHNAVRSGNLETVRLLIEHGDNPRLKGWKPDHRSVLSLAALYGHRDILAYLSPLVPEQAAEALAELEAQEFDPERIEAVRAFLLGSDNPGPTNKSE